MNEVGGHPCKCVRPGRLRVSAVVSSVVRMGLALAVLAPVVSGCVRRTLTIQTEPTGALVYLNDEEVGRSPVTTDFLWYGDYEVIIRKEAHQTLHTHAEIKAPWYQVPPIDFFAEVLYVGKIHDARFLSYALEPERLPDREKLLERAEGFRRGAISEGR